MTIKDKNNPLSRHPLYIIIYRLRWNEEKTLAEIGLEVGLTGRRVGQILGRTGGRKLGQEIRRRRECKERNGD